MKDKSKAAIDMGINERKGMPANDHWQIDASETVFERGYGDQASGAFLPRPGKDRARPFKKINEVDH